MTGLIEKLIRYLVRVYMPSHHIKKKPIRGKKAVEPVQVEEGLGL